MFLPSPRRLLALTCLVLLCSLPLTAEPPPTPSTSHRPLTPEEIQALTELLDLEPGTRFDLEYTLDEGPLSTKSSTATGVGNGIDMSGQSLDSSLIQSPPTSQTGDTSSQGGGSQFDLKAKGSFQKGLFQNPFLYLGLIALAFCAYFVKKKSVKRAVLSGAIALASFLTILYPIIGIIALAVTVAWALFNDVLSLHKETTLETTTELGAAEANRFREALRAVVAGVDDVTLPEATKNEVKKRIEGHADEADSLTIREVKMADGVGKFAR